MSTRHDTLPYLYSLDRIAVCVLRNDDAASKSVGGGDEALGAHNGGRRDEHEGDEEDNSTRKHCVELTQTKRKDKVVDYFFSSRLLAREGLVTL
jgi:hypothetical protein